MHLGSQDLHILLVVHSLKIKNRKILKKQEIRDIFIKMNLINLFSA